MNNLENVDKSSNFWISDEFWQKFLNSERISARILMFKSSFGSVPRRSNFSTLGAAARLCWGKMTSASLKVQQAATTISAATSTPLVPPWVVRAHHFSDRFSKNCTNIFAKCQQFSHVSLKYERLVIILVKNLNFYQIQKKIREFFMHFPDLPSLVKFRANCAKFKLINCAKRWKALTKNYI